MLPISKDRFWPSGKCHSIKSKIADTKKPSLKDGIVPGMGVEPTLALLQTGF